NLYDARAYPRPRGNAQASAGRVPRNAWIASDRTAGAATLGARRDVVWRPARCPGGCQVSLSNARWRVHASGARRARQGVAQAAEHRGRVSGFLKEDPPVDWTASLSFEPSASRPKPLPSYPG